MNTCIRCGRPIPKKKVACIKCEAELKHCCLHCKYERHLGCHDECDDYQMLKLINENEHKQRMETLKVYEYFNRKGRRL